MINREDYPYYKGKTVKLGENFSKLYGCSSIYRATVKNFYRSDPDLVELEIDIFNGQTKSLILGVDWIVGIDFIAPLTAEQRNVIKGLPEPYSTALLELSNFLTK